jgi:flagella basal body P-ring formation protein FlgA
MNRGNTQRVFACSSVGFRQPYFKISVKGLIRSMCCLSFACHAGNTHSAERFITFRTVSDASDRAIRLADVADLTALPIVWRTRAADLVVARLRPEDTRVDIRAIRLAEAARRQLPAIAPWLTADETQSVVIISRSTSAKRYANERSRAQRQTHCMELTHELSRGEAISVDGVRPVACPKDHRAQRAHYDLNARLARAPRDLVRGDILDGIAQQRLARVRQGEDVATVVQTGAITVTRTGTALADTAPGRPVILATGNREIIAAPATAASSR